MNGSIVLRVIYLLLGLIIGYVVPVEIGLHRSHVEFDALNRQRLSLVINHLSANILIKYMSDFVLTLQGKCDFISFDNSPHENKIVVSDRNTVEIFQTWSFQVKKTDSITSEELYKILAREFNVLESKIPVSIKEIKYCEETGKISVDYSWSIKRPFYSWKYKPAGIDAELSFLLGQLPEKLKENQMPSWY